MDLQKAASVGFSQNTIGLIEMPSLSSSSSSICMAWIELRRRSSKFASALIDSGGTPIIMASSSRQKLINCSSVNFSAI